MKHALALVAAGIVALSLSACAGGGAAPSTNPEPPAPIELSESDSGTTQKLQVGQELVITLEANKTTGYEWQLAGDPPAQLVQLGEPEYSVESSAIGAGGTEAWNFMAEAAGEAELVLDYVRPFEPNERPAKTFAITVDVN